MSRRLEARILPHRSDRARPAAARRGRRIPVLATVGRVLLVLAAAGPSAADVDADNQERLSQIVPTIVAHDTAVAVGLIPEPTVSIPAEIAEASFNLALKAVPAVFEAPPDLPAPLMPNTPDECHFKFALPQARAELSNVLGIITIRKPLSPVRIPPVWNRVEDPVSVNVAAVESMETCLAAELGAVRGFVDERLVLATRKRCGLPDNNWGILGPPERAWHANTEVAVSVSSLTAGIAPIDAPQVVSMPAGVHDLSWNAETKLSIAGDIVIPSILIPVMAYTEVMAARYAPDVADALSADKLGAEAIEETGEAFGKWAAANAFKIKVAEFIADKLGTAAADALFEPITTALAFDTQLVSVYDVFPPTLEVAPFEEPFEASDFGGMRTSRKLAEIQATVQVSDACGREPILTSDLPSFLPIGDTLVTWRVEDRGPNPDDGQDYSTEVEQLIRVRDTQPPLLLAPPSKVLETSLTEIDRAAAEIGFAVAVDLADPMPTITNDAPATFPRDSRTLVTWNVRDASLNERSKSQWITIKTEGTNTPPVAMPTSAETLTAEPVEILLEASDADMLDGRTDPVWLEIGDRPENGEFVAPLFPFFIEDYRTNPADDVSAAFAAAPSKTTYMDDEFCSQGLDPPRDFVYEPSYVHVTDAGDRFVIDKYFWCNDPVEVSRRISWWDEDDQYIGQHFIGVDELQSNSLVVDRDGALYYFSVSGAGSSTRMFLERCTMDRPTGSFSCLPLADFASEDAEGLAAATFSYARVDSDLGVVYITDRQRVYAFDADDQRFLGYLTLRDENGDPLREDGFLVPLLGGSCSIPRLGSHGAYGMDVDSEGALYVADSCGHRVHKFGPSSFDEEGEFVPGEYVGWTGRCTSSTNNACDEVEGRSRGYGCTDATCSVDGPGPIDFFDQAGDGPGQFYHPIFLTIDPNDVLYVADYSNFRVQRFASDGTFAGEAVSTGTGVNQGEHPGFVLGNMGRPRAVAVNATRFYVTDYDEQFLHVFDTLPFREITESSAIVDYVSNQDFHGATDTFTFTADDGLAKSAPATVSVTVDRNFRPPVALAAEVETVEDEPLAIMLAGDDPDGLVGQDLNGLDVLQFHVESLPEHGMLSGEGAERTYTPDPDFAGDDHFYFSVDDGLFSSPAARVDIRVEPENDPPLVTLQVPERIGVGFPTVVVAAVEDEMSESYGAELVWGDGSPVETIGEAVMDDGSGNPGLMGLSLTKAMMEGAPSVLTGVHTYSSLQSSVLVLCVRDDQMAAGCDQALVDVQPLVALGLAATPSVSPVADGTPFDVTIELMNAVPDADPGLRQDAADVGLRAVLPPELVLGGVTASNGSCSVAGSRVDCAFGTLANGATETVTLSVAGRGNLVYDAAPEIAIEARTTTPALADVFEIEAVNDVLADPTDTDGDGLPDVFETVFGLDVSGDDAGGDPDGDGLDNLGELMARTDAQDPDTDGDGLSDGEEVDAAFTDPTLSDTDGDGMPDGFEVGFGLNPVVDDASLDLDGDGTSNLDEYLDGTDPSQGDSDGDGIVDALDNCHLPNPDQADANDDGIGDPCDCRPIVQPGCVNPAPTYQPVLLVGEATNLADDNGLGAVDYDYEIGTTEVTNAQYVDFLVAVAGADDPHGLYNPAMGTDPQGGIERSGSPGAWRYRLRPSMANKPVNFVSWLDAARYVNWIENGRPTGPSSNATTERGAFDLTVADPAVDAVLDPGARFSLATEDEWYKAAYFDPGPPARYVLYPTGSNIEPRPMQRDGLGNGFGGDLNYFDGPGGANPEPVGVLSIGSGEPGSESAYGTRDQGGNVTEWLANASETGQRVARGGGFRDGSLAFLSFPSPERSTQRLPPGHESDDVGMRVVHLIPEPEVWALHVVALATVAAVARWRTRRSHEPRVEGRTSR